jgi:hypothetical protein
VKVILPGSGVGVGEGLELRAGELGKEEKKRLDCECKGGGCSRCAAFPLAPAPKESLEDEEEGDGVTDVDGDAVRSFSVSEVSLVATSAC